jgi:hypothetical protein
MQLRQVTLPLTSVLQDLQFVILLLQSDKTHSYGIFGLPDSFFVNPFSQLSQVTLMSFDPRYVPVQVKQCATLIEQAVQLFSSLNVPPEQIRGAHVYFPVASTYCI